MSKQNGFTILELMIVVAIIGILAAIVIPKFQFMLQRSRIIEYQRTHPGQYPKDYYDFLAKRSADDTYVQSLHERINPEETLVYSSGKWNIVKKGSRPPKDSTTNQNATSSDNGIKYYKDGKTGLCFVVIDGHITEISCSRVPQNYLETR
jgi:prepilin-type N-terminal cleavage/methylation domain-containing protein